ncbi:hypothetical protein PENTCL1PPCAC_26383, partial [Pristionchus entomophagus]
YRASNAEMYAHSSVKFYNADEFPLSFKPLRVYNIDHEINVWLSSKEGLRLFNYRVTWDASNSDNGF